MEMINAFSSICVVSSELLCEMLSSPQMLSLMLSDF